MSAAVMRAGMGYVLRQKGRSKSRKFVALLQHFWQK
jgi:hypothetical protein